MDSQSTTSRRSRWDTVSVMFEKKEMSNRDRLLLSPWQKWKKYRRFPWKAGFHIAIVILVIIQAFLVMAEFVTYSHASNQTWRYHFLNPWADGFYTISDAKDAMVESISRYYNFTMSSTDRYYFYTQPDGSPMPVNLVTVLTDQEDTSIAHATTTHYQVTNESLGPLNCSGDDLRSLFYRLYSLKLNFAFQNMHTGPLGNVMFEWNITQIYDFTGGGGKIFLELSTQKRYVSYLNKSTYAGFCTIHALIGVCAFVSWILSVKGLIANANFYRKIRDRFKNRLRVGLVTNNFTIQQRKQLEDHFTSWETIPRAVKIQFFDLWHVTILIGNSFLIFSSFVGLAKDAGYPLIAMYRITFAIGALLSCVTLMRYLEFAEKFYILIYTLRSCFLNTARFLISIWPVFFGYALFGVIVYSEYSALFTDLGTSMISLFGLLNGDNIVYTFTDLNANFDNTFVNEIYLYSFIILFICAILNIFIFIIEDAFHIAKRWNMRGKKIDRETYEERKDKELDVKHLLELIDGFIQPQVEKSNFKLNEKNLKLNDPDKAKDSDSDDESLGSSGTIQVDNVSEAVEKIQRKFDDEIEMHMERIRRLQFRQKKEIQKLLSGLRKDDPTL